MKFLRRLLLVALFAALNIDPATAATPCIKHTFVNPHSDGSDTTITRPSDWNACHTIQDGAIDASKLSFDPATQAELDNHINDTTAAHAATAIANTPAGGISATTVQAAINELDSEKQAAGNYAVGPGSSVDGEVVLFNGITGQLLKRAVQSGVAKLVAGVLGTATAGSDYENPLTFSSPLSRSTNAISCLVASSSQAGCLASADWSTFNAKQAAGNYLVDSGANGVVARTALNTTVNRTITGTANKVSVTNGDGVSGNPTLSIPSGAQLDIAKVTNLPSNGFVKTGSSDGTLSVDTTTYCQQSGTNCPSGGSESDPIVAAINGMVKSNGTTIAAAVEGSDYYKPGGTDVAVADGGTGASTASGARTNLGLVINTDVQAHDADLDALAANSTNGLWAHTGAGTGAARTVTGTSPIGVTNGDGVSGNPTIACATCVVGPSSATDNAIARYDLTTGKLLQNSLASIDDSGAPTFGDCSTNCVEIDASAVTGTGKKFTIPDANTVAVIPKDCNALVSGDVVKSISSGGVVGCATPAGGGGGGTVFWSEPQGLRLSLTNNVYVTASDVTAAGILYWTTKLSGGKGTVICYNGSALEVQSITQKTWTVSITSGKIKNIYWDCDGAALAAGADWTNDTTPSETIADEQGAPVLSSDHTKLLIGSVAASGTNTLEDSQANRLVSNLYNPKKRDIRKNTTTSNWSESAGAWQPLDPSNTGTANRVQILNGQQGEAFITLWVSALIAAGGNYGHVGIAVNATDTNDAEMVVRHGQVNDQTSIFSRLTRSIPVGKHFYQATEYAEGGTVNFYGFDTTTFRYSAGLSGEISN